MHTTPTTATPTETEKTRPTKLLDPGNRDHQNTHTLPGTESRILGGSTVKSYYVLTNVAGLLPLICFLLEQSNTFKILRFCVTTTPLDVEI